MINWHIEKRKVSDLKLWDKNPRTITDESYKKLKESVNELGNFEPLVVDTDNTVLAGNQRLRKAIEDKTEEIDVYMPDRKLTEKERKKIGVISNRHNGEWDFDVLANEFEDVLKECNFDDLLPETAVEVEEDDYEEPEELQTDIKAGDIFQLGNHRLMCGDSTKIEDVEKLMNGEKADMVFTDPPYGVDYGKKNRFLNSFQKAGRNLKDIANDMLGKDELFDMLVSVFTNIVTLSEDYCTYYVTSPQGGELCLMMMMMMMSGIPVKHVLIWVKNSQNFSLGRLDYEYQHEPILYTWKKTHKFYGKTQSSVWNVDKTRHSDLHPTMKPVELIAIGINNSSKKGEIVVDIFGGSGSTLIACEQLNRKCYMMEIEPHYCQVIIDRWEKFTNGKAKKIS